MTTDDIIKIITAVGAVLTPIMVSYFGLSHGRQNKEILKVSNGTLLAQTHTTAVTTKALAAALPTPENIQNASDAAAVLKSRQEAKDAQ